MNLGSREGDTAKIDTLGPFAAVFGYIIMGTAKKREDITDLKQKIEVEGVELWRGGGYLTKQIQDFKALVGKTEKREVQIG